MVENHEGRCLKVLCWEFHISRFCLCHHNWKAFSYTPWLPQKSRFQWIYILYRWILVPYFLMYLFWALAVRKGWFFIFLTNWGFLALTIYITWSSISVTIRYVQQLAPSCCNKICGKQKNEPKSTCSQKAKGCCDVTNDSIKWYEKIHWLLFTTGAELAVAITIIYWPLFGNNQRSDVDLYGHLNIALHLVNGFVPFIDIWVSRIPVRLYHVIYSVGISCVYAVFTGLYYAGEGGNPFNNGTYIYPQIDYENSPGTASVFAIAIPLVYMPLIHLFFYANHLMREGLLYLVKKMCCKCLHEPADDDNNNDYEMKDRKK